jgi:hypothetical protein
MLDWRSPSCLCQQWCSCQAWEQHETYGPLRHILCVGLHMFKCMPMHLPPMQNAYRNCTCSTNMLEGQAFLYAQWYLISRRWCTLTLNDLSKDSDALSHRNSVLSMHGINVDHGMVCVAAHAFEKGGVNNMLSLRLVLSDNDLDWINCQRLPGAIIPPLYSW